VARTTQSREESTKS